MQPDDRWERLKDRHAGVGRQGFVIPADAGIQRDSVASRSLDPGVHRGDDVWGVRRGDDVWGVRRGDTTFVIPAQAGIQENEELNRLDPGVRRGDDVWGMRRSDDVWGVRRGDEAT